MQESNTGDIAVSLCACVYCIVVVECGRVDLCRPVLQQWAIVCGEWCKCLQRAEMGLTYVFCVLCVLWMLLMWCSVPMSSSPQCAV